eukprot:663894-Alexandrium_andersonii.AAC.1
MRRPSEGGRQGALESLGGVGPPWEIRNTQPSLFNNTPFCDERKQFLEPLRGGHHPPESPRLAPPARLG